MSDTRTAGGEGISFTEQSKKLSIEWMPRKLFESNTFTEAEKDLRNIIQSERIEFLKEQEARFEFALRNLIPCPIKGEVTAFKLRWRGLYFKEIQGRKWRVLCAHPSKSGKRAGYEIDLDFDTETLAKYNFHSGVYSTLAFGVKSRKGGVINQTTKTQTTMLELKDTVEMMLSQDYKERFRAEYEQLKTRHTKLGKMVAAWDNGDLKFTPTCPRSLFDLQLEYMTRYLAILEARAAIEGVDLNAPVGDVAKAHANE